MRSALEGVRAKAAAVVTRKEQVADAGGTLDQPCSEDTDRLAGERSTGLLPPLPEPANVRAGAEMNIVALEAGQL